MMNKFDLTNSRLFTPQLPNGLPIGIRPPTTATPYAAPTVAPPAETPMNGGTSILAGKPAGNALMEALKQQLLAAQNSGKGGNYLNSLQSRIQALGGGL